ncbi:MAG: AcrR family transcriptional regulator [Myxococcota bacterium]|jgi:AcrR family transcriptional regulator
MSSSRRIRSDGQRSRERVLEAAVRLAAIEGLDRLSLAHLAKAAGISKSGLFGLFGSKEDLQLAIIDKAKEIFTSEVVVPALAAPEGAPRLRALCEGYLDHIASREWPSGCFFASVAAEVGGRPGPIRDRVAKDQRQWASLLRHCARRAEELGQLRPEDSADQVAFELGAMLTGADIVYLLHREPDVLARVRAALQARLRSPGAVELPLEPPPTGG